MALLSKQQPLLAGRAPRGLQVRGRGASPSESVGAALWGSSLLGQGPDSLAVSELRRTRLRGRSPANLGVFMALRALLGSQRLFCGLAAVG